MTAARSGNAATLAAAAALLAILWYGFALHEACLLQGLDGNAWRIGFEVQREFRTPFTQQVSDPLQGMFDAYFPAFSEYLAPYLLAQVAGMREAGKPLVYFSYAAIGMGATFALARSVGIDRWPALLAGFLVPVTTMPLFAMPVLYPIMALNPHLGHAIALSTLTVACFWAMGGKPAPVAFVLALAAIAATLVVALATVSLVALIVPVVAIYGGAAMLEETTWARRVPRILAAAALLIVPIALGVLHYVYALIRFNAFSYFSHEFFQDRSTPVFASVVWNSGNWGVALVLGGLLGAGLALRSESHRLRLLAATHLVTTVLFQATAWAVVNWAHSYYGPSPLYFEIATWPFSLLFVAYLICAPFAAASGIRRIGAALKILPVVAVALTVLNVARADDKSCPQVGFQPRGTNAVVSYLVTQARLAPGTPFRGFTVTFLGDRPDKPSTWFLHHDADTRHWRSIGNDLRTVGLWEHRIPTLLQYSSYITPTYYRFVSTLFARPMDRQMRSALVFSLPRESILQMLGVRFLITDRDPAFGRVVAEVLLKDQRDVRLIELPDPNLGSYSPTRAIQVGSAQAALDALVRPGFDGRTDVVLDDVPNVALVPATRSRLDVLKDGLRVSAESRGHSLLLLPVQYSRCWELEASQPGARLLRANLVQLAVLFEGRLDAELRFRFGPFWASHCRFEDIRDVDRLRLREARGPAVQ